MEYFTFLYFIAGNLSFFYSFFFRIKTNGSLSRDKQSLSPLAKTPDSPKNGLIFTFDKS